MQMSSPPRISTVEVVGLVTALANAPSLKGAMSTIATNGAERAKNNHKDVSAISFLEPREHARQVSHKQCGINRHVENGRDQREPRFLKSPEISHRPAHPG